MREHYTFQVLNILLQFPLPKQHKMTSYMVIVLIIQGFTTILVEAIEQIQCFFRFPFVCKICGMPVLERYFLSVLKYKFSFSFSQQNMNFLFVFQELQIILSHSLSNLVQLTLSLLLDILLTHCLACTKSLIRAGRWVRRGWYSLESVTNFQTSIFTQAILLNEDSDSVEQR